MFCAIPPRNGPDPRLIQSIFKGFNISVERIVITELKNSTYFARLILQQQNELAAKSSKLTRRPSIVSPGHGSETADLCHLRLFEQVEDMSEVSTDQRDRRRGE